MSFWGLAQLGISTVMFLLAAMAAKQWGMAPSSAKLLLTLALYTAGNLIMLRLVREFGMSVSFSLSAVIQLVSVNVVALAFFGERLNALQATGMVLAIAASRNITVEMPSCASPQKLTLPSLPEAPSPRRRHPLFPKRAKPSS